MNRNRKPTLRQMVVAHHKAMGLPLPADLPKEEGPGSKHSNRWTKVDGINFQSAAEAQEWGILCLAQRAGQISGLRRQVKYRLRVNRVLVCTYTADFVYYDRRRRCKVVSDKKGFPTEHYRIKRALWLAVVGTPILEV